MSTMQGSNHIFFAQHPNEEYVITNPNFYARGILLGSMFMELGDSAKIVCEETNLECTIDFLVKGYFTGEYDAIKGRVKDRATGKLLYELSGKWTDQIFVEQVEKVSYHTVLGRYLSSAHVIILLDAKVAVLGRHKTWDRAALCSSDPRSRPDGKL